MLENALTILPADMPQQVPQSAGLPVTSEGTMNVKGRGTVKVRAGIADISIQLKGIGTTTAIAQRKLVEQEHALLEAIRRTDAKGLRSCNFSLRPNYGGDTGLIIKSKTFVASLEVAFFCPVEKAGVLLENVLSADNNQEYSINVRPTKEALAKARQAALQKAAQSALAEGQLVLETLQLCFTGIKGVEVERCHLRDADLISRDYRAMEWDNSKAIEVTSQQQEISATVALKILFDRSVQGAA